MFDYEGEGVCYLEMVFTSSVEDGDDFFNFFLEDQLTQSIWFFALISDYLELFLFLLNLSRVSRQL